MAADRGLPSVPRGLPRELTAYLSSIDAVLRRLSGDMRGAETARAVRAAEVVSFQAPQPIGSSAITVDMLCDGAVTERKIRDGAVTGKKLAQSTITPRELGAGAVTEDALEKGSVATSKLCDRAVTDDKIGDGAVVSRTLADHAVTEMKLAGRCVTGGKIADAAVGTAQLEDGSVTAGKMAPGVIPVPPVWRFGNAVDGESVVIPGSWKARPVLFLASVACTVPASVEAQLVHVGPDAWTEATDGQGAGTGVWSFTARGDFTWIVMGDEKETAA